MNEWGEKRWERGKTKEKSGRKGKEIEEKTEMKKE